MMPKSLFLILFGLIFLPINAQKTSIALEKPLHIPIFLSGTFGELRSNHFHSGLDIKTNGKEGYRIYSVNDGYVYRIKISKGGYGKAVYIKHPNGLISVYGHLRNFNDRIGDYIKQKQYEKQSYEIEIFPYQIELPVKKGEIIGYSGNTGGSMGAHLHFELRNLKEHPLNPMRYGITVEDKIKPIVQNIYAYALDSISHVNQVQKRIKLNIKKVNDSLYVADTVVAYGKIGIGLQAFDRQDKSWSKNGLYKITMRINGLPVYESLMEELSFARSHYINTLIDYEYYEKYRKRIQKLWVEPYNLLEIYTQLVNDGKLDIRDKKNYYISIVLSDFNDNQTEVKIPVYGLKTQIIEKKQIKKTPYLVKAGQNNRFAFQNEVITFGNKSAYYDFYLQHKNLHNGFELSNTGIPLHKSMQIKMSMKNIPEAIRAYAFIGRLSKKGKLYAHNTSRKNDTLIAYANKFGKFQIDYDSIPPKIKEKNFKKKGELTNYRYLKLRIWDDKTGIKSYNGYIDDEWVLFEYDYKTSTITYHFSDKKLKGYKHKLKLIVSDRQGNTAYYNTIFYKKD
jgi:hypothetical protein